jgi:Ca-activated chloride channel family protein
MASFQGTAIGDAIDAAQQAFSNVAEKSKAASSSLPMAKTMTPMHLKLQPAVIKALVITTIGVGTEKGGMIPELSDDGMRYKMDENGQPVRSKLNEKILQEIASVTQGKYYNLNHPAQASQGVKQMIQGLDKGVYETQDTSNNTSLYLLFLYSAFILLLLNFLKQDAKT